MHVKIILVTMRRVRIAINYYYFYFFFVRNVKLICIFVILVTETQPKRKFISQFPSFKRNYNSHHSVEERDIDYASMPPPLPKIVSSDESEQTKQNCGDISRNDPPTNLIENIKTSSESIPYHDPHHKDDVILETITRTDTWQVLIYL